MFASSLAFISDGFSFFVGNPCKTLVICSKVVHVGQFENEIS